MQQIKMISPILVIVISYKLFQTVALLSIECLPVDLVTSEVESKVTLLLLGLGP
jgi:hypothetical protein